MQRNVETSSTHAVYCHLKNIMWETIWLRKRLFFYCIAMSLMPLYYFRTLRVRITFFIPYCKRGDIWNIDEHVFFRLWDYFYLIQIKLQSKTVSWRMGEWYEEVRFYCPDEMFACCCWLSSASLGLFYWSAAYARVFPCHLDAVVRLRTLFDHKVLSASYCIVLRDIRSWLIHSWTHFASFLGIVPIVPSKRLSGVLPSKLDAFDINFLLFVRKQHFLLRLLSIFPKTTINQLISTIIKLSISVTIITFKVALISPSIVPDINAISWFFVHRIVTFIGLQSTIIGLPKSISISETLLEITFERAVVFPQVFSWTFRKTIDKLSSVKIAISVPFFTLTVLQSVFEWTYKEISIEFLMHSLTIRQASPPLAFIVLDILIIFWIFWAEAEPVEFSLSMFFAIHKLSNVKVAIWINFDSSPTSLIPWKLSLIYPAISTNSNAHSFPFLPLNLSKIYLSITLDQLQIRTFQHRFKIDSNLWKKFIMSKEVTKLLLRNSPYFLNRSLFLNGMNSDDLDV